MDDYLFACFKCNKRFFPCKNLIAHIKLQHPYLQKYNCHQGPCSRSFNSISSLRKHILLSHRKKETLSISPPPTVLNYHITRSPIAQEPKIILKPNIVSNVNPSLNDSVANFVSKLYSNSSFPRNLVQTVIDYSEELVNNILSNITNANPSPSDTRLENIPSSLFFKDVNKTFQNFRSEHLRLKYFENSSSYIRPKEFNIGTTTSLTLNNSAAPPAFNIKNVQGIKICIKTRLKQFLELPGVFNKILQYVAREINSQEVISSIYQGTLWKSLQPKFDKKTVFPLLLFFDDLEPCNALGSRAGLYKLGTTYISLAGIPLEYASCLENIFLAQLFYSGDRNSFGNEKVFSDLISDLLYLENEGITVTLENKTVQVFTTLFLILGDNLGLNSILGFTESFNSDYYCRICRSSKDVMKVEVNQSNFSLRTQENYVLDSSTLSCGLKQNCIWHALPNFHVTKNIACDVMHDLLEGVLRYDMAFIISGLIAEKHFSLTRLNNRIKFFKFTKADKGSPMPQIKLDHLKKKHLVMSASEMLSLALYFGILVGDLVPDSEPLWILYSLIVEIVEILLSYYFTSDKINYLEVLIQEHHSLFCELFNEHLRPKFHFLLHYPKVIQAVGPPRHIWSMRYEAYHKLIKSTVHATTCRKNLLVTLCIKDSLRFSYRIISKRGFSNNFKHGPTKPTEEYLIDNNIELFLSTNSYSVQWFSIYNILYKLGFGIQVSDDGIIPIFGQIDYIIIDENNIYFILLIFDTKGYSYKAQSFEVSLNTTNKEKLVYSFDKISCPLPCGIHFTGDGKRVVTPI